MTVNQDRKQDIVHEAVEDADASDSDDTQYSSDEDDVEHDFSTQILSAYRRLLHRRVDLIGDYAGGEAFLIEGDSILLRCFSDAQLDFDSGFQLLHAVYNVEHFLQNLVSRKCRFSIVFFEGNKTLCIPPGTTSENQSKFLLARAAIVRHLERNIADSTVGIAIHRFTSWSSTAFQEYLEDTSPYFLMCHDGSAQDLDATQPDASADSADEAREQRVAYRQMILSFIDHGFNVALVNGLEWRDTKVMTEVQETRDRARIGALMKSQPHDETPETAQTGSSDDLWAKAAQALGKEDATEREILAILTIAEMARTMPSAQRDAAERLCAAFLVHVELLAHVPLDARRFDLPQASESGGINPKTFLQYIASKAEAILASHTTRDAAGACDLADFVDGRLFFQLCTSGCEADTEVKTSSKRLVDAVRTINGEDLTSALEQIFAKASNGVSETPEPTQGSVAKPSRVLPFSNEVFDKHLESVKIDIDRSTADHSSLSARRVFREVTHWHNAKKPIIVRGPVTPADARKAMREAKRNQLFMAEMRTYAASLTNAVGKSLEPETVIVGSQGRVAKIAEAPTTDSDASESSTAAPGKGKPAGGKKGGGGGKTAQKNAGKQAMLNSIAAKKAEKEETVGGKLADAWSVVCRGFEVEKDPRTRYTKAKTYLTNLAEAPRAVVGAEVELYLVACLVNFWIAACSQDQKRPRIQVTALIWSHLRSICQTAQVTKTIATAVELTVETLQLPPVQVPGETASDRKLAFKFPLPTTVKDLSIGLSTKDFQLLECGPYLERSFDSAKDDRVDFRPDGWQRKVLDSIDADKSVFVVAPTSAGKTFISFYAMRKVLDRDDDGVLVYVAPTKALVNQIAAEIQARYAKSFKYGGKSVWAIHTRDYRINNPTGCQVLVTVPHVLQIMLLSGNQANSWSSRVRRIIFDEIHSIGQAEDGVVWEQLLLMAPCPIVALSATVGNPEEFSGWLSSTQESIGKELVSVQHPHRYSDLRKYFYVAPRKFDFQGIPERSTFGSLGLEGLTGFNFVHPVAALVDKSRGIPEDLSLEPRDCFLLYQAMLKVQTEAFTVPKALDPAKALPTVLRKVDTLAWEKSLKGLLKQWLEDKASPFDKLLHELEGSFRDETREPIYTTTQNNEVSVTKSPLNGEEEVLQRSTLPLLCRLHQQDALPAILFNYDRHMCERICKGLLDQLKEAELKQKKSGPKWAKTLERFEEWKKVKDKTNAKAAKETSKKSAKSAKSKDDAGDADRASKLDLQREAGSSDDSKWESFDPEGPMEGYHFADYSRVLRADLEVYVRQLRFKDVPEYLIESLDRGVGVHHAGMNRKYRQIVEILFRKGFLHVIIATGTLALGINMPCKTVVFSGDSVFLTALNFRQAAGRAGRRGFDLLGNVVFQGISRQKVCKLISSRLPDLNGHFPITTTLVLRLFSLLFDSKQSKYALSAINSLLSQPRLYMGGPSFKDQTMHHLRFSIEYLRQQQLLGADGQPLNFAGLVSHLYFTENSSFAFHALLKEGYFHELCSNINNNEKDTLETLMLVLAHLFKRIPLRQADSEYRNEIVIKPSSSIVFLPPMPAKASAILMEHNKHTLDIFKGYVETFVEQNVSEPDNVLPLSRMAIGSTSSADAKLKNLPASRVRSSFVALSGVGDDFTNIHDMCSTVRNGVFLEESVIPHVEVYPEQTKLPLNAWLLDFYKHGDVATIERANGVRRSDIWFELNDFSLILATVIASLMNFMKLVDSSDLDMLEVMGNMDAHEEAEDDKLAATEQASDTASVADSGVVLADRTKPKAAPTKKQAKNADSWEDLADDFNEADPDVQDTEKAALGGDGNEELLREDIAAWDAEGGEGLKLVLKAFKRLHEEFTIKFKAMWA